MKRKGNKMSGKENDIKKTIDDTVKGSPVVMFVKGTPEMPMCGFSKGVMDLFQHLGVPFKTVDVIGNPEFREGIKAYTNWPTIPQIFIKGEFIGCFDIVRELYSSGE